MIKCTKCGLPETYETIEFSEDGICNLCHQNVYRDQNIDWASRKLALDDLIEEHRGRYEYDCIVPFSGGKDSTFTLYYLMTEYKIKPLVVQFNHGFMRRNLLDNNVKTFKKLGCDVLSFTPDWNIVKKLMLESLIRKGDFCWHCHTGIFSYPMQVAIKYKTPLVFWGEPSSEYTAYYDYRDDEIEMVDETRFNRFVNLGISAEDMFQMLGGKVDQRDLAPFAYPPLRELKQLRYQSLCLGSFIKWNVPKQSEIIKKELDWRGDEVEGMPPDVYSYEKIECYMQGVRDYLKYLKRGYSRVTQMTALDIRAGRMSRSQAEQLINDWEGKRPPSLDLFLDYLGITEEQFNKIALQMAVSPFYPNIDSISRGKPTHDFNDWYRE